MSVNGKAIETVPTAARISKVRRTQLQLIQQEKGHANLSVTINEALDAYVEAYLRGDKAA